MFDVVSFDIDRDLALLLYLGIMTDTGSFRDESTTAKTHRVAAKLIDKGLCVQEIFNKVYETVPFKDLKYFTEIVSAFDALDQGQIICVELPKKVLKNFSKDFDLRDKVFRYLRAIKGVEVLVIFTEEARGKTRVNFRSLSRVDVATIASQFGGGGHSRASGCLVEASIRGARQKVLRVVRKALEGK